MPVDVTGRTNDEVKHGYTLGDLQEITSAAARPRRVTNLDYLQRWDIAWEGVIDALYDPDTSNDQRPSSYHLTNAGRAAIGRHVHVVMRQRGFADDRDPSVTGPTLPRFLAYWSERGKPTVEDRVVERVAIWQVVATLRPVLREAVDAFAECGDYDLAAELLGIRGPALRARIATARREVLALWCEGETPTRPRTDKRVSVRGGALDTHCHAGHEWSLENTRWHPRRIKSRIRMERVCRACERVRRGRTRARAARQGVTVARHLGDSRRGPS